MADTFSKPSNQQQKLKWARIWFDKLVGFHGIAAGDAEHWDFSADQVIAFLRCNRDFGASHGYHDSLWDGLPDHRARLNQRLVPVALRPRR